MHRINRKEHRFKLLINLHRDGGGDGEGVGGEGTRHEGREDGEIAPGAIKRGPAAIGAMVDLLQYVARFLTFSGVRFVVHGEPGREKLSTI